MNFCPNVYEIGSIILGIKFDQWKKHTSEFLNIFSQKMKWNRKNFGDVKCDIFALNLVITWTSYLSKTIILVL